MARIYRIERTVIHPKRIESSIVGPDFTNLTLCNDKIRDYAEAQRKSANLIQHHAGQSVVFFKTYRVEYTRLPSIQLGE